MMILLRIVLMTGLMASSYLSAQPVVDIYQPNHKLADELIQTLLPIYQQDVQLATEGKRIVIRGEQATVNQIQELLLQLDHPPRVFHLEISHTVEQQDAASYSTQSRKVSRQTFTIYENAPLVLAKENLAQQLTSLRPRWSSVKHIPTRREALELNLQSASDTVYIDVKLQTLSNGQYQLSSNRISGPVEQWLAVIQAPADDDPHRATWSTRRAGVDNLFIKVTPVN